MQKVLQSNACPEGSLAGCCPCGTVSDFRRATASADACPEGSRAGCCPCGTVSDLRRATASAR
eukprot:5176045-Lingulodinium_polyedra.AAC.1